MPTSSSTTDHTRAEARRQQILCAAAQCFREHGFHGASIAQISKSAGMSAGHIYHYFDNKEAIIAAIVAQDLEGLLKLSAELRAAGDIGQALIERAAEGVDSDAPDHRHLAAEAGAGHGLVRALAARQHFHGTTIDGFTWLG